MDSYRERAYRNIKQNDYKTDMKQQIKNLYTIIIKLWMITEDVDFSREGGSESKQSNKNEDKQSSDKRVLDSSNQYRKRYDEQLP